MVRMFCAATDEFATAQPSINNFFFYYTTLTSLSLIRSFTFSTLN